MLVLYFPKLSITIGQAEIIGADCTGCRKGCQLYYPIGIIIHISNKDELLIIKNIYTKRFLLN